MSSLGNSANGAQQIGNHSGNHKKAAAQFTTGTNTGGYELSSVTVKTPASYPVYGSPGDLTVAIYSNGTNNKPNASLITLSGSNPTGTGQFTYTCSSSCALTKETKYHLVLEAPDATGTHNYYAWEVSTSDSEVAVPSNNGWSIGESFEHLSGAWRDIVKYLSFKVTATRK